MFVIFVCPIFSPAATQMIEAALAEPHVRLGVIAQQSLAALAPHVAAALARIDIARDERDTFRASLPPSPEPHRYVIVATGNIHTPPQL